MVWCTEAPFDAQNVTDMLVELKMKRIEVIKMVHEIISVAYIFPKAND